MLYSGSTYIYAQAPGLKAEGAPGIYKKRHYPRGGQGDWRGLGSCSPAGKIEMTRNKSFIGRYLTLLTLLAIDFLLVVSFSDAEESQEPRLITISDGIRMVMKDSRLLKISLASNDTASADALIARSALLPQVSISFTDSFLRFQPGAKLGASSLPSAEKKSVSYGLLVYQTFFDFGKTLSNYRAAKETLAAQKANSEQVKKLAVLEFVVAYFDILEAEKLIQVAEKEAQSLAAYLSDVRHLYEQGAAVKNDLLPAQVKLADARRRLIVARNARHNLAARLNNILALPVREKIAVQDVKMSLPAVPEFEQAWRSAQEQRPELAIISDKIKAAALSEKAQQAKRYPAFYAQAGYAYKENKFQTHQDNINLDLGANMDLFDGGLIQANVYKARSLLRGFEEQKSKLTDDIKLEIEESFIGFKDAREKVLVAKEVLQQAGENVRVMRAKYKEGVATTTDVLEAIALQTSAETNYYTAEYELKRNYTKLMYSMGIDLALVYDTIDFKQDESKGK
jgi:outer membrane protein TolC